MKGHVVLGIWTNMPSYFRQIHGLRAQMYDNPWDNTDSPSDGMLFICPCYSTGLSICPSTIDKKFHQEEEGAFSDTVFHTTLLNIVPWVSFIEEQWSSQSSCSFYSSVPVVLTLLLPDSHWCSDGYTGPQKQAPCVTSDLITHNSVPVSAL